MKPSTGGALAVLVAVTLACGIRDDELQCEEAVAKLSSCCPGFDAGSISCVYDNSGCTPKYPDIPIATSACIRQTSCGDFVARGVCAGGGIDRVCQ